MYLLSTPASAHLAICGNPGSSRRPAVIHQRVERAKTSACKRPNTNHGRNRIPIGWELITVLFLSLVVGNSWGQSDVSSAFTFSTLAGYTLSTDSDGPGPQARFGQPTGIARDASGNTYIVDRENYTIRQISAAGIVSTIAGLTGVRGMDDGLNTVARFYSPSAIAADPSGNVYVADNNVVRRLTRSGTNWVVSTIAGQINTPGQRDTKDGGGARFNGPAGMVADGQNTIYVADSSVRQIQRINNQWEVTTLANATGQRIILSNSGPNIVIPIAVYPGTASAIARDHLGNLYVADTSGATVSKLSRTATGWTNTLIAGIQGASGTIDGLGNNARLSSPTGIAVDRLGTVYIADGGQVVRRIRPEGSTWRVSTVAGSFTERGDVDGVGEAARFDGLLGMVTDDLDNLIVTDAANTAVRKVSSEGVVKTLAGANRQIKGPPYKQESAGMVDGVGSLARFDFPGAIAVDGSGTVYAADTGNNLIRVITPAGIVTSLAGKAGSPGHVDGVGDQARFGSPEGIAVDSLGNVFVADGHAIRMISPSARVRTIAGSMEIEGDLDGDGTNARFRQPYDVAVDRLNNLLVSDAGNNKIRKLTRQGDRWVVSSLVRLTERPQGLTVASDDRIFTLVPGGIVQLSRVGVDWTARQIAPLCCSKEHIAMDSAGRLFVPTVGERQVVQFSEVGPTWQRTVIGGGLGFLSEGGNSDGAGAEAKFKVPFGVAVDSQGNVYISDVVNNNIRKGSFTRYSPSSALPYLPPPLNAALNVTLSPAAAGGQWRFPWEQTWRESGTTQSLLSAGDYTILLRGRAGYLAVPPSVVVAVTNGGTTSITSPCYPTLSEGEAGNSGSLTVLIGPGAPAGAGWRFLGNSTAFLRPGLTTNLVPEVYAIEFAAIPGRRKPATQSVQISPGAATVLSVNYLIATPPPPGVLLPQLVPTAQISDLENFPFGYNGQLQTDTGFGSGVAVEANVVLTAAHLVFNDQTLSFVGQTFWYPRGQSASADPKPLEARGYYVLSGYASQRTNDIQSGLYAPEQSTPQSRNFDAAALYFLEPVSGGGHGGYLPSDATPSPWLTGRAMKMLVGYPVDGSQFGDASLLPGRLYQTLPQPLPLSPAADRLENPVVYTAPWFLSYPGNSGGPVYARFNDQFLPAGIYLGTLYSGTQPYASAVRAIDGNVTNLISLARLQSETGTNHTGGGVVAILPSQNIDAQNKGYLQFQLGPPAAVSAGAGWKLQGDTVYGNSPNYIRQITSTNVTTAEFRPVPGWLLPTNQSITVLPGGTGGQISSNSAFYTVVSPVLLSDPVRGLGIAGTTGTTYRLEWRNTLTGGSWTAVSTHTILSNGFNPLLLHPTLPQNAAFYRVVWLP